MINQDYQQHSIGLNQFTTSIDHSVKFRQNRDANENHCPRHNYNKSVGKSEEKIIEYTAFFEVKKS